MANGQEFRSLFLLFELSQPIWDCYIFYHHQIETKPRVSEIGRRTVAAGRFILATNIESSSDFHCSEILWNYKNPN
jgi:hypothetical protein